MENKPDVHEWISHLWYMYTMEYFMANKNNELWIGTTT